MVSKRDTKPCILRQFPYNTDLSKTHNNFAMSALNLLWRASILHALHAIL